MRRQGDRFGDIKAASELGELKVTIFDFIDIKSRNLLKHFKLGSSTDILELPKALNQADQGIKNETSTGHLVNVDADVIEAGTGGTLSR